MTTTVRNTRRNPLGRTRLIAWSLVISSIGTTVRAQAQAQTTAQPSSPAPAAQSSSQAADPEQPSEGAGMFMLGVGAFDFSSLSNRLAANGYERIRGPMTIIGGEGHTVFKNGFVAGGRGAAILVPDGDGPGNLQRELGGGFGMLDLGFALVHTRSLLFMLLGGFGGMSLSIDDNASASFDDVLAKPRRSTSLSRGGVLVGVTLGIDGRIATSDVDAKGQRGFFTLGARVGALYGPAMGDWGLPNGNDASRGPDLGLAGGYVALAIGFGGGR